MNVYVKFASNLQMTISLLLLMTFYICDKIVIIFETSNALFRITRFTSTIQRKNFVESFIIYQFSYFPLIWMSTCNGLNKTVGRVHEKSLTSVLNDRQTTLDVVLDMLKEKTTHQLYIDRLMTEVYNFLNGCSVEI